MTTKERIINAATKAFNENGYGVVSLYELATSLNISRGNLTYHFKSKEVLLQAISDEMWEKIEKQRAKSRTLPSFENLHNEAQLYRKFQKEYSFIFLDPHVLKLPSIKKQFREMISRSIEDNKAAIAFSIQLGNMNPEPVPGIYNNIAFLVWMTTYFWLTQQKIRGEKENQIDGEKILWSLLVPHFTTKGIKSFKKFFGNKYYDQLGEPFDIDIDSLISF